MRADLSYQKGNFAKDPPYGPIMNKESGEGLGRGALYLIASNVVLLITSYAIHFGLGRYLDTDDYGTFGVIFALMNTVGLVLASGLPDATAKYIAEDKAALGSIIRSSV